MVLCSMVPSLSIGKPHMQAFPNTDKMLAFYFSRTALPAHHADVGGGSAPVIQFNMPGANSSEHGRVDLALILVSWAWLNLLDTHVVHQLPPYACDRRSTFTSSGNTCVVTGPN